MSKENTILIIEPDETKREITKAILSKEDFDFIDLEEPTTIFKILEDNIVDVIFLAMDIPDHDSLEILKELHENEKFKDIPVIISLTKEDWEIIAKSFSYGALDFFANPLDGQAVNLFLPFKIRTLLKISEQNKKISTINTELDRRNRQMERELDLAKIAQEKLLPEDLPSIKGLDIAVKYVPNDKLSGDLYDIMTMSNDFIGMLVADVTGHGISAAFIATMLKMMFTTYGDDIVSPNWVLETINTQLSGLIPDGKFISIFYGIYNSNEKEFSYASGGHPPAFLFRPETGEIERLKAKGSILGIFEGIKFQGLSIKLKKGDKVLLYTDGLTECQAPSGKRYGEKGLLKLIKKYGKLPVGDFIEKIYKEINDFLGDGKLDDDLTMVVFEVTE